MRSHQSGASVGRIADRFAAAINPAGFEACASNQRHRRARHPFSWRRSQRKRREGETMMEICNVVAFCACGPRSSRSSSATDLLCPMGSSMTPLPQARRGVDPWLEATPRCEGDFYGWKTTRVGAFSRRPKCARFGHEPIHPSDRGGIAEAKLRLHPTHLTQAVSRAWPRTPQAPHRDEEMWPWPTGANIGSLNVMWAVSDSPKTMARRGLEGGSHRAALDRRSIPPTARGRRRRARRFCFWLADARRWPK